MLKLLLCLLKDIVVWFNLLKLSKVVQSSYLKVSKNQMAWCKIILRIFVCFNSTRANKTLELIRQQAISSARLYLEDLGIELPKNATNEAILNLAWDRVNAGDHVNN